MPQFINNDNALAAIAIGRAFKVEEKQCFAFFSLKIY
jgi:hypothetical protein